MNRTLFGLAVCMTIALESAVAQATLIDFTIPDGTSFAPIPPTYQPLAPAVAIIYNNVGIYNGTPDHTTETSGTDNYYTYPSSGNGGTETFSFSTSVNVSSFWYGVFDNTDPGVKVVASIYSNAAATGTPLATVDLTPTFNSTAGPLWTEYDGAAFSGFNDIRSLTFTTTDGGNDAVNIDDISVTPAPEPATCISLGSGLVACFLIARRRRKAALGA